MSIPLYIKDNTGAIRVWDIDETFTGYCIEFGQLGGAMQEKFIEVVEKGGRDIDEQIELEINSRITKQLNKGYVYDLEKAKAGKPTNALGFVKPMLAQKDKPLPFRFYLQYKLNGNRCLITKVDGELIAYSRGGKLIKSIDHILEAAKDIPEGTTLDGELYRHGTSLQTLRSWIAKKQADSNRLEYHCYDIVQPVGFSKRLESLKKLTLGPSIKIVESTLETSSIDLRSVFRLAKSELYEGLIARDLVTPYEDGKRSNSLIKIKKIGDEGYDDAEFKVLDISASRDGWAMLQLVTDDLKPFKVSAPGTMAQKFAIYHNRKQYIGKYVTVEWPELTDSGIPSQPIAVAWREQGE